MIVLVGALVGIALAAPMILVPWLTWSALPGDHPHGPAAQRARQDREDQ